MGGVGIGKREVKVSWGDGSGMEWGRVGRGVVL